MRDPTMPARKAAGIDTIAGLRSGNTADAFPIRSTQTVGLKTINRTDKKAPHAMEQTAPVVLNRRQTIESNSGGKLALQAIAKASPTMNATFWPLNRMPRAT